MVSTVHGILQQECLAYRVNLHRLARLLVICSALVIQNGIPIEPNSIRISYFKQTSKILFAPPFGCSTAFLLELTQIVKIVDIVAVASIRAALTTRWEPDIVDADPFEIWESLAQTLPMLVV